MHTTKDLRKRCSLLQLGDLGPPSGLQAFVPQAWRSCATCWPDQAIKVRRKAETRPPKTTVHHAPDSSGKVAQDDWIALDQACQELRVLCIRAVGAMYVFPVES